MRILISLLDWGLGHATRCIPIIHSFLRNDCEVYIACNAMQQRLLENEFENVHFLLLEGYNIRYASSKRWFAVKILQQIPKILFAIRRENRWLKKVAQEHRIDLIISDNRFGFYHKKTPSVFITHQLFIQTPSSWFSRRIQKINYHFINRFCECWVPDYEGHPNLAGVLSHPEHMPSVPVTYIGPLSRFKKKEESTKYEWLLILSGPEPQRTLLEQILIDKFITSANPVLLVRGLPASTEAISLPAHFTVFNHLSTAQLEDAFAQSRYVISRSGYTTVMDIVMLQKKSLLIPTPGQTEQEYLAKHLAEQHWCINGSEPGFFQQLPEIIGSFEYHLPQFPDISLNKIISETITKYNSAKT